MDNSDKTVSGKVPLFLKRGEGAGKSFTLIELLVVIAIIAILAALLLPVLKSSRDRGLAASCQSNMKQMGVVLTNYISEKNSQVSVQYLTGSNVREWTIPLLFEGNLNNIKGQGVDYMRCPSLPPDFDVNSSAKSYFAYGVPCKPENIPNNLWVKEGNAMAINTLKIKTASRFGFFFDTASMDGGIRKQVTRVNFAAFDTTPTNRTGNVHTRHARAANIAFADGHVAGVTPEGLIADMRESFRDATNLPETLCYYDNKFTQKSISIGSGE